MNIGTTVRTVLAALTCLTLAGCMTTPPEQDPVVQKLTELDSRLLRLERVLTNQSLLDLQKAADGAQADIRVLRGQLDELRNSVGKTQDQQRELYGDVDRRLAAIEGNAPTANVGAEPRPQGGLPVPQGDDRANYQAAFDLLKDGKYADAINGFKQFMTTFPNSALADNAQYWLGEAYYVTKEYNEALRSFRSVVEKYPDSRKIPDALLKIGYCNYELKNWAESKSALNQVVQQYADTTAARLASQRLAKLAGEGR